MEADPLPLLQGNGTSLPLLQQSDVMSSPSASPKRNKVRKVRKSKEFLDLLLPVLNFSQEETGVGKYTFEMAQYFSQQGHKVKVICAPPYYPWWKVQAPYSNWKGMRENIDGIDIHRCPLYVPQKPTGVTRALHLSSIGASVVIPSVLLPGKADVVWMAQPSLTLAPAALMAAKRTGAKAWMHVQDLEVAAAQHLKVIPQFATPLIALLEKNLYSHCHTVSTISPSMAAQLRIRGAPDDIPVFPNWVDVDAIQPLHAASPYRTELGLDDSTRVVLYSGNMGEKQGLEIVLNAARRLAHRQDILFILAGQGNARDRLEREATGIENLRFLPLQPFERMQEFLGLGDVHLVPQSSGMGDLVMPSKMTAILSAGRPVVATCDPHDELASVVGHCGLRVAPADDEAFAHAVESLVDDPARRHSLGMSGRMYAEQNLSSRVILPRMEAHLWKVAGLPAPAGKAS
jgi:colanic acid biosynthesis glycosyl transferase WcaI